MAKEPRRGDRVEWNTPQGKTHGRVERKLTGPTDIQGHHVAASPDNPEYLVRSDRSGKLAAHRPEALKKRSVTVQPQRSSTSVAFGGKRM